MQPVQSSADERVDRTVHQEHTTAAHEPPPSREPVRPAQPMASEPEPPRRRSTVREAVHSDAPSASVEIPQPVIVGETEDASKPRRAGWWSRRVLGKD
jgi:ribonuclease E